MELNTSDSQVHLSVGEAESIMGSVKDSSMLGRPSKQREKAQLEVDIEEDKEIDAAAAKAEIVEMTQRMRQLRILYKMREVTQRDKFRKEIHKMKLQLTSNSALWE